MDPALSSPGVPALTHCQCTHTASRVASASQNQTQPIPEGTLELEFEGSPCSGASFNSDACKKCRARACTLAAPSLTIPASVKLIGDSVFIWCAALTAIIFAEGSVLETIGDYAFEVTGLAFVDFPATLESIGSDAFSSCASLTAITFAEGSVLKTIGYYAFEQTGLASVDFPATLESINEQAFAGCDDLTTVKFNGSTCYGPNVNVAADAFEGSSVDPKPALCPSR